MFAYIVTDSGATVFTDGAPFSMTYDHKLFLKLVQALQAENVKEVESIIEQAKLIKNFIGNGNIEVSGGHVTYKGKPVGGVVVNKILEAYGKGLKATNLINFLDNLMENPSYQSREELYLFLEACNMPITEDGRFIAYKWVRDNYKDVHSGKFDNSIGQIVSMPRHEVNDDRRVTCSHGLHVCSNKYTKFGARLMLVAVNPRDVVSVPNDYDNGKMRVCEYEVIGEIAEAEYQQWENMSYWNGVDTDDTDEGYDSDDYFEDEDEDTLEDEKFEDAELELQGSFDKYIKALKRRFSK